MSIVAVMFTFKISLYRFRAEVVRELLCEMNPDVLGHALNNSVQSMVDTEPALMKQFSLVIVANQPASLNLKIAALCWSYAIPLIIVRSIGYVGYIRLQLRYYSVQILCNFLPCFTIVFFMTESIVLWSRRLTRTSLIFGLRLHFPH